MSGPVRWLEGQLDKAKQDLENAQQRVKALEEVIRLAREERSAEKEEEHATAVRVIRFDSTILEQIEAILKERGALRSHEIHGILLERGRTTTVNSVNTQLNRHKHAKFEKTAEGRWRLAVQEESAVEEFGRSLVSRGEVDE